jgi:hypothetical protein
MAGSPNSSLLVVPVVEDEPLLRMLAVEVVEEAGFVALEAGDADEAVALHLARYCFAIYGHRHARKRGRAEAGPCGAWPLATSQDPRCVGTRSAAAGGFAVKQLLHRKAIRCGGNGRGIAFADRFPDFSTVLASACAGADTDEQFCSDLALILLSNSGADIIWRPIFPSNTPRQWDQVDKFND